MKWVKMRLIINGVMTLCARHCNFIIVAARPVCQQYLSTCLHILGCLSCLGHVLHACRPP